MCATKITPLPPSFVRSFVYVGVGIFFLSSFLELASSIASLSPSRPPSECERSVSAVRSQSFDYYSWIAEKRLVKYLTFVLTSKRISFSRGALFY